MLINGRYEVVEVLGGGSHASVFRVIDRRHGDRPLALKLLRRDRPTDLLRWEFSQLRRLAHPNVARVYDLDTVDRIEGDSAEGVRGGALFMTQDLVDGRPADAAAGELRDDSVGLERWVVAVGAAISRALGYLHDRGIVHRDVKPANVMVEDDPHAARLIDLSLSIGGVLGRGQGPAGSLAFMAPEAMAGAAEPRSDLFGLGVTLYALLAGRLPFGGDGGDAATTVRAILDGRSLPLGEAVPGVTDGLSELVQGLLSPDPTARPASARAVLLELGRLFGPDAVGLDGGTTGVVDAESEVTRATHDVAALARSGVVIGRDRELDLLLTLLADRLDPYGRGSPVLAVVGPAGVGKSALLREAGQKLQLRAASAGARAPLILRGSIRHVASSLRRELGGGLELPRLSSWLGEGEPSGAEADGRDRSLAVPDTAALCEELSALAIEAAASKPVVLHIEAGLDDLAGEFVAYLHRRGEVEGLASDKRPPLSVVVELRVEPGQQVPLPSGVAVVEVRPLGDDEVKAIIADRLGSSVSEPAIKASVRAARGRPLLLFAFLSKAAACGPLDQLDEAALSAAWGQDVGTHAWGDAAEVLSGALAALPRTLREVLLGLALWGRAASGRELAHLLDVEQDAAVDALGVLWRMGHIVLDEEGRAEPVAPDVATLARVLMGDEWTASVHRRAFALLGAEEPTSRAAIARHAAAAGLPEAAELNLEAGEELLAAGDPMGAIGHLEVALDLGGGVPVGRASSALRRALRAAGQYERAAALWVEAVEEGERGAKLALAQILRLAGRAEEARRWATAALEEGDDGDASGWGARALLARLELDLGQARAALSIVGEAAPGDASGQGAAAFEEAAGLARLALGEIDLAREHFEACLALAQGRDPLSRAHNLLGMVAHQLERWSEASRHYGEAEALARAEGHAHAAATYGVNVAVARLEAGELGEALSPLRRAVATLAGVGRTGELAGALYNYASLLVALGDTESGLRAHGRALAAARKAEARHVEAYCSFLLGDLLRRRAAPPDLEAALEAYRAAVDLFVRLEAHREELLGRLLTAEVLADLGRADDARQALAEGDGLLASEGELTTLRERRALALARISLAGAGDVDEATVALTQAMDAIRAMEPLDLRWRAEALLARLHARRGDRSGAVAALERAESLIRASRRHVPEEYVRLWATDPERAAIERLRAVIGVVADAADRQWSRPEQLVDDPAPLRRLLHINKRLNSELRLGRLLDEIIDTIVELTDAERGFLLLKGKDGALKPRSARNVDRRAVVGDDMRLSRSIAEQVVASGEPVLTVDAQSDGRFDTASSVHALRLRSILAVPLRVKGDVVGAVYVDDRVRPGAFGEGALQLVLSVADQAAIAIENARLLSENRRRQRKIEALNRRLQAELDRQKVELEELRRELDGQRRELATKYSYDAIVARSAAMTKLFRILDRVTDSEVPVVIQGESGTGKELCARAIHFNGPRSDRPFVTENCGAIPETLLESVLFGHVKGAFTGADRNRQGLFEVASGGTLLLDEISEMSPAMQAKLLRVLQEGELRPVGGNQTVQVDVRIITSSNRDLGELVRRGAFREDLYYRLNVITVRLPALRERAEDVPLLVDHFVAKHGGGRVAGVDKVAMRRLTAYGWPGNVRQLENEVMRAVVLADDIIREEHLTPEIVEGESGNRPDDLDLKGHVAQLERRLIRAALDRFKGNQSRAAQALGLSRFGLQKKMARYEVRYRG